MSSTTIRYSTLPENSQSISLTPAHPPNYVALPVVNFYGSHESSESRGASGSHKSSEAYEFRRSGGSGGSGGSYEPRSSYESRGSRGSYEPGRAHEADPDTPGAYRYDPDTYDPSIPDSDPRSPRYEPPHLRHQPGDTFEIGGKPHDPDDPGPYGTPGWYQDQRTGRHRRGELPDPLSPDVEPPSRSLHRSRPVAHESEPELEPEPRDYPSPIPSPSPPVDTAPIPSPASPADTFRPSPYRRYRPWASPTSASGPDSGHESGSASGADSERDARDDDQPYRFSPLREGAMQRFLELSQPFRDAHFQPQPPTFGVRLLWLLRWSLWVAACGLLPAPRPLTAERRPASTAFGTHAAHAAHAAATASAPPPASAASAASAAVSVSAARSAIPSAASAAVPDAVGASRLSETPRQRRPRAAATQTSYIAAWERRFDAHFPVHARTVSGGAL